MICRSLFLVPALVAALSAQEAAAPTSAHRRAVLERLAKELKSQYVFPEVAVQLADAIAAKEAKGGYDGARSSQTLAEALTADLREFAKDRHFLVRFDPTITESEDENRPPTPKEWEEARSTSARMAFGISKLERLQGNIGYLEILGFGPPELVGPAFASALSILSGTEALILDLRRNGGGDPGSVAQLLSHFFGQGDARHLNSIYNRPSNRTRQHWTSPTAEPRYLRPVYVLVSSNTFSGGEECAYDFQTQKRGTLVGERTRGGANPGQVVVLGGGFNAFIPTGRAVNPVTGTNWDGTGVLPDVAVPASEARRTAHVAALKGILAREMDPPRRKRLEGILARIERGEE